MNPYSERIALLRESLVISNLDIYIVSSNDPHLGEYVPDYWRIIRWLAGFTGSAGTLIVTASAAGLWTDSRYFIQAEKQLRGSGITLFKPELPDQEGFVEWLSSNHKQGDSIGLDGRTFSIGLVRKIEKFSIEKGLSLNIDCDLISGLWIDRPSLTGQPAFDHPPEYCGKERSTKIKEVREEMTKLNVDYQLLTSLDDIMWLLNIRGSDLIYSPLITSFALLGMDQILFFVDETRIPLKLAAEFDKLGIVMLPYEEVAAIIAALDKKSTILITPGTTSAALFNSLPKKIIIKEDTSIPHRLKAVKNKVEIENISKVMVKDGVALSRFFCWLETALASETLSELSLAEKLTGLRSEQENFHSNSFQTIVAYNAHGALPHYSASPDTDSVIVSDGLLLIDSGGQYLDGTTDITRTIALAYLPVK